MTTDLQKKIQLAKSYGYTDEQIQAYLAPKRTVPTTLVSQPAVSQPKPKSVGGFISNVGSDLMSNVKGIASLPGAVFSALQDRSKIPQMAGNVAKGVVQEYSDLITNPVDTAYNKPISTILNVLPVAGAVKKLATAGKVGKVAETLGEAGKLANAGEDLSVAGRVISKVNNKVGGVVKNAGEELMLKSLKPTKSQLTQFKAKTGTDLTKFMAERGLTGDFANASASTIEKLQTAFDDIAVRSQARLTPQDLDRAFGPTLKQLKSSPLSATQRQAAQLEQELEAIKSAMGQGVDVGKVTELRREADKLTRQFGQPPETASLYQNIRDGLQTAIRTATKGKTVNGKDLEYLGKELNHYYEFDKIAGQQANVGRGGKAIGLVDTLSIGAGGGIGGIPGAAAGYLASKIINSPKTVGLVSKGLQKFGAEMTRPEMVAASERFVKAAPGQLLIGRNIDNQAQPAAPEVPAPEPSPQPLPQDQFKAEDRPSMGITAEEATKLAEMDLQRTGGKNLSKIKQLYDLGTLGQTKSKPPTTAQVQQMNLAKAGLRSLNIVEQILGVRDQNGQPIPGAQANTGVLFKQLIPGQLMSRDYDAAAFAATEALLRARSGAAVPETEVRRYQQKLFPAAGDPPQVVVQKLAELRATFGDMLGQEGAGIDPNSLGIGLPSSLFGGGQ